MYTGLEICHKLNVTNLWINFFTTSIPAFSSFKARIYSWVNSRNRGHFPKSCPKRRDSVKTVKHACNVYRNCGFSKEINSDTTEFTLLLWWQLQEHSITACWSNILPTNNNILSNSPLSPTPTLKQKTSLMKKKSYLHLHSFCTRHFIPLCWNAFFVVLYFCFHS